MNPMDRLKSKLRQKDSAYAAVKDGIPALPRRELKMVKKPDPIQSFVDDRNYDDNDVKKIEWPTYIGASAIRDQIMKEQPEEFVTAKDAAKTMYLTGRDMNLNSTKPYDGYFNRRDNDESNG